MEMLEIIPEIIQKLNSDPLSIIKDVSENIEILGFHLDPSLITTTDSRLYILLAQIYFIQRNYQKCIEFAIKGKISFGLDFFSKFLFFRMLDEFKRSKNFDILDFLKNSVVNKIIYKGYLVDCDSIKLEKEDFVMFGNRNNYLDVLKADGKGSIEFMKFFCDACIFHSEFQKINSLLDCLDGSVLYEICFYCSENSFFPFSHKNEKAQKILSGELKNNAVFEYLRKNMKIETTFLEAAGRFLSHKNSVTQMIVGYSMALNALGSANDSFFRVNSDLFANSKLWAKFAILGSFGLTQALNPEIYKVLENVLPNEQSNSFEGGTLLALGIAHVAWNSASDKSFLLNFVDRTPEIAYGAILGLGLNAMGSRDEELTDKLLEMLKKSEKIVVEGICSALGQIWIGTGNCRIIDELKSVMNNSVHEREVRSAGVAIALINMGREKTSLNEKKSFNWIYGYAKCLELGCSFVNSKNVEVLSKLLEMTRDLSGDVRRAAIFSIGLLFCGDKEKLIEILIPYLKSHCIYIRHATCITLGIFLCGTGDHRVAQALEVLLYDEESLVCQAACIGLGFLLVQNNHFLPNYTRIVEKINQKISKKHETMDTKMGAIIARSLMVSGGTNIIFSPFNMSGKVSKQQISGFVYFFEFWFWYPFINFIGISYLPTTKFVFNNELQQIVKTYQIDGYYGEFNLTPVSFKETKKRRRSSGNVFRKVASKPNTDKIVKHNLFSGSRMWFKACERVGGFTFEFLDK
ncbi:26S proteasome regulatory subunit RPN2 [Dictyocoela muelleri]|nr:26S proteasome regulatory subunit RPN2 [Dictyocoela muelleri]